MDEKQTTLGMIDCMICPGFCAAEGKIIRVNEGARRQFLEPGMEVLPLIESGKEEYEAFTDGCLYLTICLAGVPQGAAVVRMDGVDIFMADQEQELRQLQLLALAAQELRIPMSNVMMSADQLTPMQESEKARDYMGRLNRGMAQMLRLVGNMSDALRYSQGARLELRNLSPILSEIFERAAELCTHAGVTLRYSGLSQEIYTMVEEEQLERAVYNLISNALKFTPKGGTIEASLRRSGRVLRLTVQDSGSGIAQGILSSIFSRYLRQPSLEDSRYGLGLGLVLVRAAAANHGGTVLIDQPDQGTRVTMTIALRENAETMLRSKTLTVDYAGERDHGLIELSGQLPPELYHTSI